MQSEKVRRTFQFRRMWFAWAMCVAGVLLGIGWSWEGWRRLGELKERTGTRPAACPLDTRQRTQTKSVGKDARPQPEELNAEEVERRRPAKEPCRDNATVRLSGQERLLLGRWQREFCGRQELEMRADHVAILTAWPTGVWRVLLGSKIQVRLRWTLTGRSLTCRLENNAPGYDQEVVRRLWGETFRLDVVELTQRRVVLQWPDGDTDEWFRVDEKGEASLRSSQQEQVSSSVLGCSTSTGTEPQ